MSAIRNKAKRHYRKLLKIELFLLLCASVMVWGIWAECALSFLLGALAGFIPYCFLVYWVFFRAASGLNPRSMAVFYQGEALKWLITIGLIVAALKGFAGLHVAAFFAGYFLMLMSTSLLPLFIRAQTKN